MRFICGLTSTRRGPCNEWFESWADIADHMNVDHRLSVWIAGGTISQEMFRSDRHRRKEIMQWLASTQSQQCTVAT